MTNADAARLLHEMSAIGNYLVAAEDVVKSGHMPDMTGLENRVASLCEAIQAADEDAKKQCLPVLFTLLEKLNVCEKAIRASQTPDKAAGGTQ